MRKRILIISNRGSADKSPVAELLLMPRLGGHLMSIETTNDDAEQHGQEVIRHDPENFTDYLDNLGRAPGNTVTHVGATDFLAFVNALTQTHALIHYDFVIVVVNRTRRSQTESVVTIQTLLAAGMDPSRLRIVLDEARTPTEVNTIPQQYEYLFPLADTDPRVKINPNCYIEEDSLFSTMLSARKSWKDLMADRTDYIAELEATTAAGVVESRIDMIHKMTLQRMAHKAAREYDRVFAELEIGPADLNAIDAATAAAPSSMLPPDQHDDMRKAMDVFARNLQAATNGRPPLPVVPPVASLFVRARTLLATTLVRFQRWCMDTYASAIVVSCLAVSAYLLLHLRNLLR